MFPGHLVPAWTPPPPPSQTQPAAAAGGAAAAAAASCAAAPPLLPCHGVHNHHCASHLEGAECLPCSQCECVSWCPTARRHPPLNPCTHTRTLAPRRSQPPSQSVLHMHALCCALLSPPTRTQPPHSPPPPQVLTPTDFNAHTPQPQRHTLERRSLRRRPEPPGGADAHKRLLVVWAGTRPPPLPPVGRRSGGRGDSCGDSSRRDCAAAGPPASSVPKLRPLRARAAAPPTAPPAQARKPGQTAGAVTPLGLVPSSLATMTSAEDWWSSGHCADRQGAQLGIHLLHAWSRGCAAPGRVS